MNSPQHCFLNMQRSILVDPLFEARNQLEQRSYLLLRRAEKGSPTQISESVTAKSIADALDQQAREIWRAMLQDVKHVTDWTSYEEIRKEYKDYADNVAHTLAQVKEYL
jgi:pyoverdine/dityrosine biosynthesis protein Dit1